MTTKIAPAPSTQPVNKLHAHVRESLLSSIHGGSYAPGAKLPSEHALCEAFGVSRITVRQALADLERLGYVDRVHGRGTYVRKPKAYQQVTELQGFSKAMAPQGYEVRNRLQGFSYLDADAETARLLGVDAGETVGAVDRVRLLDGTPVSFERTLLRGELARQLASADLVTRDLFAILEADLGRTLGHAQLAIEAATADAVLGEVLDVPEHTPLLKVLRHVFDETNQPLAYEVLHFRTDSFQYRMRVDRVTGN